MQRAMGFEQNWSQKKPSCSAPCQRDVSPVSWTRRVPDVSARKEALGSAKPPGAGWVRGCSARGGTDPCMAVAGTRTVEGGEGAFSVGQGLPPPAPRAGILRPCRGAAGCRSRRVPALLLPRFCLQPLCPARVCTARPRAPAACPHACTAHPRAPAACPHTCTARPLHAHCVHTSTWAGRASEHWCTGRLRVGGGVRAGGCSARRK